MKTEFIKNISLLIIINVIIRPLYIFGVDLKIQNILGPTEYGIFFIIFDFTYLFLFINDPGLQSYSVKTIAKNRDNPIKDISEFLSAKVVLSVAYIIICLMFAYLVGYDQRRLWLTFLVSLGFALGGIFVLLRSVFSAIGAYKIDSYLSGIDKALMIIILGSLAWGLSGRIHSVEQMVIWQNVCYCLAIATSAWILFKKLPGIRFGIPMRDLISLLQKTLPYTGLILLTAFCNRIDVIMLDFLRPDGEFQSGIYAAGYRFLDAGNMFGYLAGALLLPMYASASGDTSNVSDLFSAAFKFLGVLGLFIMSVLVIYGEEIFGILYSEAYRNYHHILKALIFSLVPIIISHSTGSLLIAKGKIRALNFTYMGAIVLNILLNWIFIPKYGALGSAYTTLITEIILISISVYLSIALCKINFDKNMIIKFIFLSTLPLLWYYLEKLYVLPWYLDAIIYSIFFLILTIRLKLFDWAAFQQLLHKKKSTQILDHGL